MLHHVHVAPSRRVVGRSTPPWGLSMMLPVTRAFVKRFGNLGSLQGKHLFHSFAQAASGALVPGVSCRARCRPNCAPERVRGQSVPCRPRDTASSGGANVIHCCRNDVTANVGGTPEAANFRVRI
jgi:hypothetical protein